MSATDDKIKELEDRLERLVRTQIGFQQEVTLIRNELKTLRTSPAGAQRPGEVSSHRPDSPRAWASPPVPPSVPAKASETPRPQVEVMAPSFGMTDRRPKTDSGADAGNVFSDRAAAYSANARADLEKFIGENLISKIGIVVLIIGVGIGVKYSIDNELISPLARVVASYVFGFGLIGFAVKLKAKYHNFSAALLSGGMAIMYFVTYFAYSLYGLMPQSGAFALMVMFTVFTVVSAWAYERQIIAHIGLVGAYGVPFLLSSDSGNYVVLFTYMTIVNAGILAVSLKRRWKTLFFTASGFTWLIFLGWFSARYNAESDFFATLLFLSTFFAIFYAVAIIQKEANEDGDGVIDLASAMITGFIFYSFCIALVNSSFDTFRAWAFFSYLAGITAAILATSFRFLGRSPVYLAVVFSWLTYGVWFADRYNHEAHSLVAPVFAGVLFASAYITVLWHRLATKEMTVIEHTGIILTNAFVFYGFGYAIAVRNGLDEFLGFFTVANAALHFIIASVVTRLREDTEDVAHVLIVLVVTFISIAIPVQFDGNVVTMIWAAEAAFLFWMARRRKIATFEYFSYPVMVLAVGSMFYDWLITYGERRSHIIDSNPAPLANGDLITALVVVAALAFIYITDREKNGESVFPDELARVFRVVVAVAGTFILYNAFRLEIANVYYLAEATAIQSGVPRADQSILDLGWLSLIWQLDYTMGFIAVMAAINISKIGSRLVAFANSVLAIAALAVFLTAGMLWFYELRDSYLMAGYYPWMNVGIRYISYGFATTLIFALYSYSRSELLRQIASQQVFRVSFEAIAAVFILIAGSCELMNIMAQYGIPEGGKLGLSIFWAVFSIGLIAYGIAKNRKHMRVAAICLLGFTLLKLFFYDAADLDTIPKTILFVTIGIALLIASFLYNKYKALIFNISADEAD